MLINIAVVSQSLEYPYLMFHYKLETNCVGNELGGIERFRRLKALWDRKSEKFKIRTFRGIVEKFTQQFLC